MLDLGTEPGLVEAEPEVELLTFTDTVNKVELLALNDTANEVELLVLDDFHTRNDLVTERFNWETHNPFAGIALLDNAQVTCGATTNVEPTHKGKVTDFLTMFLMSHWKKMQSCHA